MICMDGLLEKKKERFLRVIYLCFLCAQKLQGSSVENENTVTIYIYISNENTVTIYIHITGDV